MGPLVPSKSNSKLTIGAALDRFVLQLEANGRSPHTIGQYRRHVRLLASWLRQPHIEKVTHEVLARFLASPVARARRGGGHKKPTTSNALRTSLRVFFAYCEHAGYSQGNPARMIQRARCGAPHPRALSEQERERLLAALAAGSGPEAERDRVLFRMMLMTGVRIGSALSLDIDDVDLEQGELRLRRAKGDREERVFLPESVRADLNELIDDRSSGPVFTSSSGFRISIRHASRRFRRHLKAAGIRRVRGTHCLRHTFATWLYGRTGDVLLVKEALCHRAVASTLVYARADERRLREAVTS